MSHPRPELLKWAVHNAKPRANAQYPHGFHMVPKEQATAIKELHEAGYFVSYPDNPDPQGNIPCVITDKGAAAAAEINPPLANVGEPAPQSRPAMTVTVEDNIPIPQVQRRGFQSTGESKVEQYGFDNLRVNQSFHLPPSGDADKPTHRTFSSTVSQANKKLHPKAFLIREVGADDPQGPGARVWRVADLEGPRPTRTRSKPAPAAPAPQPAAQGFGTAPQGGFGQAPAFDPTGGFPAPQAPGFGTQAPPSTGGFGEAPGGFGAPPPFSG